MPLGKCAAKDFVLLVLGAALYTIASPPYEWAGAAWLALTPLFLVLHDKTPKTAFAAGLLYGVLCCVGVAYWVYFAVFAYFPFSLPLNFLFTLLSYSFFVGLYTGLAACLSCVLMRRGSALLCWGGVPALWVSSEFARSSLFSGFSWELLGYTQYRHLTFVQITDITGVHGLSFLIALSGYVAAEILNSLRLRSAIRSPQSAITLRIPWPAVGGLAMGIALVLLYGTMRLRQYPPTPSAPAVTVALVRGEVPSVERWNRVHYASTLLRYISLTNRGVEGAQPDLVVWPEFAVGFYLDREPLLRAQLGQLAQKINASLLLGAPRVEESETGKRYYNSAYLISPTGKLVDVYDKIRLIPFAEYRPLTFPVLYNHSPEYPSEFTAGKRSTVFPLPPQGAFGVMICYEATYPYLARHLVQDGAQFLINISNDTWLVKGGGAAAAQHFSMAVFRAVENRRSLARMAAAGISGFIDPAGRLYQLSAEEEGVILGRVFPRQELTVYARYGDWFALTCVSLACVALLRGRQRP